MWLYARRVRNGQLRPGDEATTKGDCHEEEEHEEGREADQGHEGGELKQVNDTVTALVANIDPANMSLLNDRLTQLRKRKEGLENELRSAQRSSAPYDVAGLRKWARDQLAGLHAAMAGTRNDRTRDVIASYVERITVWPSQKRGEMLLNPGAAPLWKRNDRPEGRSRVNKVGATVRQLNFLSRGYGPGSRESGFCWP